MNTRRFVKASCESAEGAEEENRAAKLRLRGNCDYSLNNPTCATKAPTGLSFFLLFRLFKKHALTQGRVELHKLDLTFSRLSILTGPDNMLGLRGFKP